jgi:iron transport multicopper oxidase
LFIYLLNIIIATVTLSSETFNLVSSQYKIPTKTPTLLDAISGTTRFPASSNVVNVANGSYVFLQIINDDAVEHVFHLHGHTFWVRNAGK